MDAEKRDWGRINPIDYVPLVGIGYRIYWWMVARRGELETNEDEWRVAATKELSRLFIALVFTVGFGVFVILFLFGDGGYESALRPSVLFILVGIFVHKIVSWLVEVF
ncbi:MAG: hypothetical protein SV377_00245 [Halobacteria archaeon]|nr:hypothetical protein [Halobacteria archaeon]